MEGILDQSESQTSIKPTAETGRILHLDIFRGFAIFGIFMVNILVMNVSFVYRGEWQSEHSSAINDAAIWILETFFFSKFFTIFSFLFGIGVALQIRTLKAKMINSNLFLTRRFAALLLFGIAHILFIWSGDILHLYALFGFILMLMYQLPPFLIFISAVVVLFFPYFDDIYQSIMNLFHANPSDELTRYSRDELIALKRSGSYASGVGLRISEYGFMLPFLVSFIVPIALTMTLLGLYSVKKGIIDRLDVFITAIRIPFGILFAIAMIYRFTLLYWVVPNFDIEHGSVLSFILMTFYYISEIMTSLFFLVMIALFLRHPFGKKLLSPLQYVGHMAFTNYILQSVIGYVIMRTLGYYDSFSPAKCILIVIVVFAFQIPLSWIWLKYFKYGPLEWLWRCLSYWKVLGIRRG